MGLLRLLCAESRDVTPSRVASPASQFVIRVEDSPDQTGVVLSLHLLNGMDFSSFGDVSLKHSPLRAVMDN